jgi:hypothetical protein
MPPGDAHVPQVHPEQVAFVRFPARVFEPVVFRFVNATVEVMVAKRVALKAKYEIDPELWAVTGAYVLLGLPQDPVSFLIRARPGMVRGDLLKRMDRHLATPDLDWFDRAILIRDSRGFDSAEAGYLEGRLHELCDAAAGVEHDFRKDYDESVHEHIKSELDRSSLPCIRHILDLVGVPLETETELSLFAQEPTRLRGRPDDPEMPE